MKKRKIRNRFIATLLACIIVTMTLPVSGVNAEVETAIPSQEEVESVVKQEVGEDTSNVLINEDTSQDTNQDTNQELNEVVSDNNTLETVQEVQNNNEAEENNEIEEKQEGSREDENAKEDVVIKEVDSIENLSEEVTNLYDSDRLNDTSSYATKTLIVFSDGADFEKYEAITVINFDNMYILQYDTEEETKDAYKKLKKDKGINSVEIDSVVDSMKADSKEKSEEVENSNADINNKLAEYLNTQPVNKNQVKVAVLDTGINYKNEEFKNRIIDNVLNFSSSGSGIMDDNGHGTEVSSIIAENTHFNVKLLPIKVVNENGKGTLLSLYLGIQAAIDNNADIINISLSTYNTKESNLISGIVNEATKKGIIVIAAAGNDSNDVKNYVPANIENVITVGSVNKKLSLSEFSNYGSNIDYVALGEDIKCVDINQGGTTVSGTSFSTALVTSIVSKMKGIDLSYSQEDITNILNQYAIDLGEEGFDNYYGNGLLSYDAVVTENNHSSISPDIKGSLDINDCKDWKELSDEVLNNYFFYGNEKNNAYFLQNLTEEDLNLILSKHTMLIEEYSSENFNDKYYKYLLAIDLNNVMMVENFRKLDGYFYLNINGGPRGDSRMKITMSVPTLARNVQQGVKWNSSIEKNAHNIYFRNSNSEGSGSFANTRLNKDGTWTIFVARAAYTIPAGYHVSDAPTGGPGSGGRFNYKTYNQESTGASTIDWGDKQSDTINYLTISAYAYHLGLDANKEVHNELTITLAPNLYTQTVNAKFEKEDGTYTDPILQETVTKEYGQSYSWSRGEDNVYYAASEDFGVISSDNTRTVIVRRKEFTQTVKAKFQNADGEYGNEILQTEQNIRYGNNFSWSRGEDNIYFWAGITPYTVTEKKSQTVEVKRKSNVSVSNQIVGNLTESGWYKGKPTVSFIGSDPNLNISTVTVNKVSTKGSIATVTANEGNNTYNYSATNVNGASSDPQSLTVQVDVSVPTNLSISAPTAWSKGDIPLTVKGQDIQSGLASFKVQYSADNSNWTDYGTKTFYGQINDLQTITEIYASKNGYYRVVATDRVGYTATSSSFDVTNIDKSNPTLAYNITGTLLNGWYKEKADLNLTASDTGGSAVKSITVNNNETSGDKRTVPVNTEGANQYNCFASDNAGNNSRPPVEVTIQVDKTAPINLSMKPNTTEWINQPIKITAKADDTYSGVDTIELQYTKNKKDKDSWRTYQVESSFKGNNQASKDFSVTDNGYYRLVVTDRVGYQSITTDKDILEVPNYDPNKPDSNTIGIVPDTIQWVDEPTGVEVTSFGSDELSGLSTVEVWERNGRNFEPKAVKEYQGETSVKSANYDTHINEDYKTRISDQAGNELVMSDEEALEVDNIDPQAPDLTIESVSSNKGYISTDKGYVIRAVIEDSQSGFSEASLQKLNNDGEWEDYKAQYQIIRENESEQGTEQETKEDSLKLSKERRKKYFVAAAHVSLEEKNKKETEEVREQGENKVIIEYTVRENGTYRLRGADLVKNTAFTDDVIEIKNLDDSMPVIRVEGNPTIWQNTDATIEVYATDEDSKIVKMTLDGQEKEFTKNEGGEYFFSVDATKNQDFTVTAVDEAGNTTTEVIKVTKIDKEAPELTTDIKKSWLSLFSQDSRNLKIDAFDGLSGIEKVSVTYQEQETILKQYDYEKAKDRYQGNYKIREEGNYTITVTDQAGNVSVQTINEANLDSGAPKLSVEGNPSRWQNKDAVIKVISTDNKSKISKMTLDNQPQEFEVNESGEAVFYFTVQENQKFMVAAYDEANNVTLLSVDVTKIDKVVPFITVSPESKWKEGYRTINVLGEDDLSGIEQIVVYHTYSPESIVSYPYEKQQKNYAGSYKLNENGNYVLKIKDKAGNTSFTLYKEWDAKILKAMEVVVPPDKTTYYETEDFKKKGMVVDAIYTDNSRSKDIKDYVILNGTSLPLGQNKIDLSYTEMSVTVYTDTPIKVIKEGKFVPGGPDTPEKPIEPENPVTPVGPKVPITPNPTPLNPTVPEVEEEKSEIPSIEKKVPEKTLKAPETKQSNQKLPIGAVLAGAGLFLFILFFFLLRNVKVYSMDEEGEWKYLGKTRAKKAKEQFVVSISKLLRIRATSNKYKLVFSKMFKKFHEECDLVIKIDKQDYEKHLDKDSDTVYVDHIE